MKLSEALDYRPRELAFGTSGLRGLVADITQLEAYVNTRGFLGYLLRRRLVRPGGTVFCAGDLRPSTDRLVPEQGGRGEILQAVCRGIEDSGLRAGYVGKLPSPALMCYALQRRAAGIMVTGSHIPSDRNGIKYNTPGGEVLKSEEGPILAAVSAAREAEYRRPASESLFDARGMLRPEHRRPLPQTIPGARQEYLRRYLEAFPAGLLAGKRILVYQHSSVSRELLVEVLRGLGAEAVPAGWSETFMAIDTEAVDADLRRSVQALVDENGGERLEAVVSADGDGDRPMLLAIEGGRVRFIPGDLLGILAADFLKAHAVTVPVNASDAVELFFRPRGIEPRRTRIGSPYVIAALREVGWEANGGFLTAVPLSIPGGGSLAPLPTRDAMLPILCALGASLGRGLRLTDLVDRLPARYGSTGLRREFPRERFQRVAGLLTPKAKGIEEASFGERGITARYAGRPRPGSVRPGRLLEELGRIRSRLHALLAVRDGFAPVAWINWLDGVRIGLADGEAVHLRASGNAPELRVYAFSGSQERAERVAELLGGEILERMEREAEEHQAIEDFRAQPGVIRLRGAVQHYPWGGARFIPELLGRRNDGERPFAELWLGAHPKALSEAELGGRWVGLDRLIAEAPEAVLGRPAARRFGGRLPYLLKILDARSMLSIQVHPSLRQARAGFAREQAAGIPLDSPMRNYQDDNHKPEVQVALSELWLLHGFRPLEEIAEALAAVPELRPVFPDFSGRLDSCRDSIGARRRLLRELYGRILSLPKDTVDALLGPLLARLERKGGLDRSLPEYWLLQASRLYPLAGGHYDRGLLSFYLLNLVHLAPGQGTFQPAGTPHAYLQGVNVELMANSDNVLRGGLSSKHVDAAELLRTLSFESGKPEILEARLVSATEGLYPAPAREFRLSRIEVSPGQDHRCGAGHGTDCLIVLEGKSDLRSAERTLPLARGAAALIPPGLAYVVEGRTGRAVLYRATVPV
jgi:phosphomannomutase